MIPHATIGKIADDCKNIGTCLYNIATKASEFSPYAYLSDLNQGMANTLQILQQHDTSSAKDHHAYTSKTAERTQRNAQALQTGLYDAIQTAQVVVEKMMNKSLRQNVADGAEITVDNLIIGKVADSLMNLSQLVGNQVLQVASDIKKHIPSDMQGIVPKFVQTNGGQLIAIVESTGENIGAAVAAKRIANNSTQQIIKNAAQAKNGGNFCNNGSGDTKPKVEPKEGSVEYKQQYPNGKYKESAKHHANSPGDISKPPRNGQAAFKQFI